MRPILAIASGAFLVLLELSSPAIASASQTTRFSVADTIAVQRPSASVSKPAVLQDPTGRRAALVLMKGELKSDSVIYSLLLIDLERIARDFSVAPRSDGQVFQTAVTLRSTGNDPAIQAVRWAADGESLTFIGQQTGQPAQVYRLHVATRRMEPLTRADSSVIAYDANETAVIYSVRILRGSGWFQATAPRGYVVQGWETLQGLTTPASIDREWMPDFETFVLRANAGRPMRVQKAALPQQLSQLRYWLSPTGRHAIAEWRLSEIPESWAEFVGADGYRLAPRASAEMTRHGFGTQLVLIDGEEGVVTSLLQAPTAPTLRNHLMRPTVAWAPDGQSAVVSGSYLAPEAGMTASERAKRLSHPALVAVEIPSRRATVIHDFESSAEMQSSLIEVSKLGRSADGSRVSIDLSSRPLATDQDSLTSSAPVQLTFERAADGWRPVSQPPGTEPASPPETAPVAVEIKEDMNQPPLLIAREHQSGREAVLLDLNPQLSRFDLPRWEVFEWRSRDGQSWRGGLLLPKARREGERVPLVIQTHGFSTTRFLVDGPFSTAFAAQPLAASGFAVLQMPDDPLTIMSDDPAVASREGAVHLAAYESAIGALADKGLIDRERVGLVGFSRTVYHVGYALAFARFPLKAVVASDGVDMGYGEYLAWLQGLDPLWPRTFELRNGGNPFDGNIANWVRQVPHFNLQHATAALRTEQLDHTHTLTSWEMHMAMRRLGLPSELVLYAGGKHELFKPSQRYASMQGTVDWMRFWVKDEEDADPTKAEQYARWRELRKQRDPSRDTAQ